jgi:hypothetical protein
LTKPTLKGKRKSTLVVTKHAKIGSNGSVRGPIMTKFEKESGFLLNPPLTEPFEPILACFVTTFEPNQKFHPHDGSNDKK